MNNQEETLISDDQVESFDLPDVWCEQQSQLNSFQLREDLFSELEKWAFADDQQRQEGDYLLLLGDNGAGKSACLSQFVYQHRERHACLFHMIKSQRNPRRFLQFLNWQAAQLLNEPLSITVYYGSINELRNILVELLEKLQAKRGNVLVVIDALDELDFAINQLHFLPISLPKGVKFLLSARPTELLIEKLKQQLIKLTFLKVTPLVEIKNIKDFYLELFFSRPAQGRNNVARYKSKLLQLLSIAFEPLSIKQLTELLNFDREQLSVEETSILISELSEQLLDYPGGRFLLRHKGMADYLHNEVLAGSNFHGSIKAREIFVRWLNSASMRDSIYRLRYLPIYLEMNGLFSQQAGANEEVKSILLQLIELLTDFEFISAKIANNLIYELEQDYQTALATISACAPEICDCKQWLKLRAWASFIENDLSFLAEYPQLLLQQAINQPEDSFINGAARRYLANLSEPPRYLSWLNKPAETITSPLRQTINGREQGIQALLMAGDDYAVTAGEDRTLRIWQLSTGQQVRAIVGHQGAIFALALTSDLRYLISGSADRAIKIWQFSNGAEVANLTGHTGSVLALAITSDDRHIISASADRTIKIWQRDNGSLINTLIGHTQPINAVAVLADNATIISGGSDGILRLWQISTSEPIASLQGHNYGITAIIVTPDGRYFITGDEENKIIVWDAVTRAMVTTMTASGGVRSLAVSADQRFIISGGTNKIIDLLDLPEGRLMTKLAGHTDTVTSLGLASDRRIISAGRDKTLKIWQLDDRQLKQAEDRSEPSIGRVSSIAIMSNGSYGISGYGNGLMKLWDSSDGREITELTGHSGTINSLAVTADNRYLISAADDSEIRIWDLAAWHQIDVLVGHRERVLAVAITPDDRYLISGSDDKTIRVWDLNKRIALVTFKDAAGVNAIRVSPDGQYVGTANLHGRIKMWDLAARRQIDDQPGCFIHGMAITANGRYSIAGYQDNTVKVFDLVTDELVAVFPTPALVVTCAVSNTWRIICGDLLGNVYFLQWQNF